MKVRVAYVTHSGEDVPPNHRPTIATVNTSSLASLQATLGAREVHALTDGPYGEGWYPVDSESVTSLKEGVFLKVVRAGAHVSPSIPEEVKGVRLKEGIMIQAYYSKRQRLVEQILTLMMMTGMVLIKAPPQAGKTSILQLAAMQLHWLQQQFPDYSIKFYNVTMLTSTTLDEAICKAVPEFKQGWRDLVDTPPTSSAGALDQKQVLRVLLLDEVQKAYTGHDHLWEQLKLTQQQPWARQSIRLLAAAAYGLPPSGLLLPPAIATMPGGESSSSAASVSAAVQRVAHDAAAAQAAASGTTAQPGPMAPTAPMFVATPFQLDPKQVVTVQPVQLPTSNAAATNNAADVSGSLSLCFDWEGMLEVYVAWSSLYGIKLGGHILQYIYLLAGGQPGLVTLVLDYLETQVRGEIKWAAAEAVDSFVSYKLTSAHFLNVCRGARSIPSRILDSGTSEQSALLHVLGKLLESPGDFTPQNLDAAQEAALRTLYTSGTIVPVEVEDEVRRRTTYRFTTPMHELVFAHLYYEADVSIPSFQALIKMLISRLPPTVLAESIGRSLRTGNPLEGTYHHVAWHTLMGLLPIRNGRRAVASSFVGQEFGVNGYLDWYVGEPWGWGIEFVRDGLGIAEHIQRFAPGGTYYKMVAENKLKEYAVLDFRATSTGAPRHVTSADNLPHLHVVRVSFSNNYTQATIRYSKGGQDLHTETVAVGGDLPLISTSAGVPVVIRGRG